MTPQHHQILNMLMDGSYHCPTVELYIKDDRKRISELNKMGYVILGDKTCKNPAHNHVSPVKLRKLVARPGDIVSTNETAAKFLRDFAPKPIERANALF